eukprot:PhF_6_TR15692/c0_g1_i2/m.24414
MDDFVAWHTADAATTHTMLGMYFSEKLHLPMDAFEDVMGYGVKRPLLDYYTTHNKNTIESAVQELLKKPVFDEWDNDDDDDEYDDDDSDSEDDDDSTKLSPRDRITAVLHTILHGTKYHEIKENNPIHYNVQEEPRRSCMAAVALLGCYRTLSLPNKLSHIKSAFTQPTCATPFLGLLYQGLSMLPSTSWYVGSAVLRVCDDKEYTFLKSIKQWRVGDTIVVTDEILIFRAKENSAEYDDDDDEETNAECDQESVEFKCVRGVVHEGFDYSCRIVVVPPIQFVVEEGFKNLSLRQVEFEPKVATDVMLTEGIIVNPPLPLNKPTGYIQFVDAKLDINLFCLVEHIRDSVTDEDAYWEIGANLTCPEDEVLLPNGMWVNQLTVIIEGMKHGMSRDIALESLATDMRSTDKVSLHGGEYSAIDICVLAVHECAEGVPFTPYLRLGNSLRVGETAQLRTGEKVTNIDCFERAVAQDSTDNELLCYYANVLPESDSKRMESIGKVLRIPGLAECPPCFDVLHDPYDDLQIVYGKAFRMALQRGYIEPACLSVLFENVEMGVHPGESIRCDICGLFYEVFSQVVDFCAHKYQLNEALDLLRFGNVLLEKLTRKSQEGFFPNCPHSIV